MAHACAPLRDDAWEPTLGAADASSVVELAQRVASASLSAAEHDSQAATLCGATMGAALLVMELERLGQPVPRWSSDDALRLAARAAAATRLGPGLWSGLSGVAWGCARSPTGPSSSRLRELLRRWLRRGGGQEYDLVDGLCGLLVLARETGDRELLELTLARLSACSERRPGGRAWRTPATRWTARPRVSFDLGVAHGIPGVAGALANVVEGTDPPDAAVELLRQASDWIWAHRLPAGSASAFPRSTEDDGTTGEPARLAWCYGDAGVLVVLARAARALGDPDRLGLVGVLAREAAARPEDSAGVVDAGLCHGAGGVGHLFGRLFALTGEASCATAARRWLERALALRRPVPDAGDFPSWRVEPAGGGWYERNSSLLTGATGAALALLSAVSPLDPSWDRVLLAS